MKQICMAISKRKPILFSSNRLKIHEGFFYIQCFTTLGVYQDCLADTKQILGCSPHLLGRWLGDQKSTTKTGPLSSDAEGSPDHVLRNAGWGTTQEKTQPQPLNMICLAYLTFNLTGATSCTLVGLADGGKVPTGWDKMFLTWPARGGGSSTPLLTWTSCADPSNRSFTFIPWALFQGGKGHSKNKSLPQQHTCRGPERIL